MAAGGKDRDERAARERARIYQARQRYHAGRISRRRRDNLVAGIVGGLIVLAAAGSQVVYFTLGPGLPVPQPMSPSTPSEQLEPEPSLAPTIPSPEPQPSEPQPSESPAP